MATRTAIILKREKDYQGIYCHWNGLYNFGVLKQHYTDSNKISDLVELGFISVLEPEVGPAEGHDFYNPTEGVTVAYNRDRGDSWVDVGTQEFKRLKDAKEYFSDMDCEYIFWWSGKRWNKCEL